MQLQACTDDNWDEGTFVLLYPTGNSACATAADRYRHCLTDCTTFDARTLDELVAAIRITTSDAWITRVYERYLDPVPITNAEFGTDRFTSAAAT